MVTIESLTRIGLYSWLLKYSSGLQEPTFYIYLDGVLIAETSATQYSIAINLDEASLIEILDDPDIQPMQIFPGKVRLGWFFVDGTEYYRVDEYIIDTWVERRRIPENNGYLKWESRFLEDGQTHLFRVVPVGTNGNEGTAKQFAVLMCRRPDVPDVDYNYREYTGKVVIYNTPLPPADYNVTGTPTPNPDCTCNYFYAGEYADHPYYRRGDGAFFIFIEPGYPIPWRWVISSLLGEYGEEGCNFYWAKVGEDIIGVYTPHLEATGTAIVSAGPH